MLTETYNKPAIIIEPQHITPHKRRRRGGRMQLLEKRKQQTNQACVGLQRELPTYDILDPKQLASIKSQTEWLLEERGIAFTDDEESLALLAAAGVKIKAGRAHFQAGQAQALCTTAPAQFTLYGRANEHQFEVGGKHVVFTPGYGSPFVSCLDHGRRYASLEDFQNFVKLTYQTPYLHHSGGTVCEPLDVPVNKRHLDMVYAHLRYSSKPFMGSVTAPERAEDSIQMARIVFGETYLHEHCVMQANINANSPLAYDGTMTKALKIYARAGQGIVLSPFIIGGAMGPVTMPALIAQAHAEALAGIALSQIVRPGTPVVYGNFLTTMNLQTGAPTFGTPEANLAALAMGQLSREINLPLRCGGHLTAAKCADAQAMQESTSSMLNGMQAGAHYVLHAAGWLEGGLTMSYEKFVMDLDQCGMLHRFHSGLQVDQASLATDAFEEAAQGTSYLASQHTLQHFETANYSSSLSDSQSFEAWSAAGSQTMEQRANQVWKQMLADYQRPPMPDNVHNELLSFMHERKASMPDQHY